VPRGPESRPYIIPTPYLCVLRFTLKNTSGNCHRSSSPPSSDTNRIRLVGGFKPSKICEWVSCDHPKQGWTESKHLTPPTSHWLMIFQWNPMKSHDFQPIFPLHHHLTTWHSHQHRPPTRRKKHGKCACSTRSYPSRIPGFHENGGTPKNSIFNRILHHKPSILENLHLWKPPDGDGPLAIKRSNGNPL